MADALSPFNDSSTPPPPPLPPTLSQRQNLSPFYYGLVVIGSIAVLLALYNLLIVGWCAHNRRQQERQRSQSDPASLRRYRSSQSFDNSSENLVSTFKYHKEQACDYYECAVCLSVFEDGEDVRQLPRCKHSFHASCIDMWLYSHSDCPLCRAIVGPPIAHHLPLSEDQNSTESLP